MVTCCHQCLSQHRGRPKDKEQGPSEGLHRRFQSRILPGVEDEDDFSTSQVHPWAEWYDRFEDTEGLFLSQISDQTILKPSGLDVCLLEENRRNSL